MVSFGEVITAMVTPFNNELEFDQMKTKKLVNHLLSNGTDSLVVSGTTGEGPTLSNLEKLNLFETVKNEINGKSKVIANVGNNNTRESILFAQEVEKKNLADGLLLVNPYYNKPSQDGLYEHFKSIAESVELPIVLYNIPGRTSVNLESNTTVKLSKIKNIVGIKESSGDLAQMSSIIENTSDDFYVYSGDDNLTLPALSIGANGVISVGSHLVGKEIKEMIKLFKQGNNEQAAFIHRKIMPFFEGIFWKTNPVPIKNILNNIGVDVGSVRLPLVDLNEKEKKIIETLTNVFHKNI